MYRSRFVIDKYGMCIHVVTLTVFAMHNALLRSMGYVSLMLLILIVLFRENVI